jgi:ribulose-phosphate 3-epimerase
MKHLVAPSLLSADFGNLKDDIDMVNQSEADWFHLDIMDGTFVPNISYGFPVMKAVAKYAKKPLDVHLMIQNPDRYIQAFRDAGAHVITVHYEACVHLHRSLQLIRSTGALAGVALNPHTPVSFLSEVMDETDLILIMSVNPGFGGQQFIENATARIVQAKKLASQNKNQILIQVDGGIAPGNAEAVIAAGANVLVAGSSIFDSGNPAQVITYLKNIGS